MTNNPTIDGVSRELLERLLTDACNENWSDLNELLNASAACRCRRFGKDNPHWPCPVHLAHGDQHGPTAVMTEAGCQAYMDADGMIGIMHNSSMGHAYVAMRALDPEFAALQSTIAQLQDRVAELESGRGELVCYQARHSENESWFFTDKPGYWESRPLSTAPPAPVAVVPDGWKLVPIEATKPMLRAFIAGGCSRSSYRDMITAAPICLDATAALNGERG